MISHCTKLDEKEIRKHIKYKSNFITNKNIEKKASNADILVEVKNKIINIEMNREVTEKLIKKNKKYVNMLDSINTEKSKTNKIDDKYIVQINISTTPRIKGTNELLYEIVLMDKNLKVEDAYNNYIIYDINLEKLKEMSYNVDKLTPSEKRLLIFAERDMERLKTIYKGDVDMKRAVDDLDTAKYFEEFDKICEIYNTEEYKEAMEEREKEAIERGMKKEIEKGISQGIKQGTTEEK